MTDSATPETEALLGLLDDVSRLVEHARAMPMSASVLVNKAEVLDLVAAAREAVPDQVAAADRIVADAEAVLARAKADAAALLAQARNDAQALVSDHEITAAAHVRAGEIEAQAQERAAKLEADADDYCDSRLSQFETDLESVGKQVAAGRARLAARRSAR